MKRVRASGTFCPGTTSSPPHGPCNQPLKTSSEDYISKGSKAAKMEGSSEITWTDHKVPVGDSPGHDPSDVAVVSQIGKDSRKWNYLHYSAVRNPEIMRGLLEKCRRDDSKNTPGPGGYTPLMLAVTQKSPDGFPLPSRSSSSSDSSGEHSEHNGLLLSPMTEAIQLVPHSDTSSPSSSLQGSPFNCSVDVLLSTRVKLDTANDYGRTALHLAAVCGRGDYVKTLLAAGANPNVQDNWGQSPLHAAIGAAIGGAAEGAFQMLLDFPKTDVNLKSDGGITPLMDAVKTSNMYMVKQLVKENANISLTDYEGRTAVHWAAMTKNVEALKLLMRRGPDDIGDTQDNKGQTALFLACREGATECTRHLLDVLVNATVPDNLDRSPMTIAIKRQHLHILELLKSHGPYHYQLPASGRHGPTVPHHFQMAHQHHEMALRQQQMSQQQPAYAAYPNPLTSHHHDMMVEMQPMPPALEHYPGPEMQPMPPPLTSSQLPVTSAEHPFPPTTYYQHSSPPTVVPTTASDLPPTTIPTSYSQPQLIFSCGVPQPDPTTSSYSAYPASAGHFPVRSSTSDSEQSMVSELITSISESSPPQQQLHSPPQQQPHSASSVHSSRSSSPLYLSPPNSDSLQHSSGVAQQNWVMTGAYPHASPPSLTLSPEGRDETHNITTIEDLLFQQHDYSSVLYGGTDSYYRFAQE